MDLRTSQRCHFPSRRRAGSKDQGRARQPSVETRVGVQLKPHASSCSAKTPSASVGTRLLSMGIARWDAR